MCIHPPPSPPHIPIPHTPLTFVGALAHRAEVLSSPINEPCKWVHVGLAAVAANGTPWTVVYQPKSVLKIGRRRERKREEKKREGRNEGGVINWLACLLGV